jgi:hypothetical protein
MTSSNYGLFIYSWTGSYQNYNYVLDCSISFSNQLSNTNYYTVDLYGGVERVISTNSSNNICYQYSSFEIHPCNSALSTEIKYSTQNAYIYYSTISNNYATDSICIWFESWNSKAYDYANECNFINNSQYSSSESIVRSSSSYTTINGCCFIKNNENGNGCILFYAVNYYMTISNCSIDNYSDSMKSGTVTISSPMYTGNLYSSCNYLYFDNPFNNNINDNPNNNKNDNGNNSNGNNNNNKECTYNYNIYIKKLNIIFTCISFTIIGIQ